MKQLFIALVGIVFFVTSCGDPDPAPQNIFTDADLPDGEFMISVIPDANNRVVFSGFAQKVTIDWGDGTREIYESDEEVYEHQYATNGEKVIVGQADFMQGLFNSCYGRMRDPAIGVWTRLNVTGLYWLRWLSCNGDNLSSLNVTRNPALERLLCEGNQLTKLDLSKNKALQDLWCTYNPLTNMDLSNNPTLVMLLCGSCQLAELDFSYNDELEGVYCNNNQLTHIELGSNPMLDFIECGGNLMSANTLDSLFMSLPMRTNESWGQIYIYDNPGAAACDKDLSVGQYWDVRDYNPAIWPTTSSKICSAKEEPLFTPQVHISNEK